MNLLAKLDLILGLVFAVGLVPAAMVARNLLATNAETQVVQNARIMMETVLAMRGSTVSQVRPLLSPLMEDTFLPQSVPAYSTTEIFSALRECGVEVSGGTSLLQSDSQPVAEQIPDVGARRDFLAAVARLG